MEFGRKLSFVGHRLKLELNLRNRLHKDLLQITNVGVVKIYDRNPRACPQGATLVATLTPEVCGVGQLVAFYDIPLDLCRGIYYDSWEGLEIEGLATTVSVVKQFYVSEDFLSYENCLNPKVEIEMDPVCLFQGSRQYIKFTITEPETMIFPEAEFRMVSTRKADVRFVIEQRVTGPGVNEPMSSNAQFPLEAVVISETPIIASTPFLKLQTFEDTGFFYFDTEGVPQGMYVVQLRLKFGEVYQITGPYTITVNSPDFRDNNGYVDSSLFDYTQY